MSEILIILLQLFFVPLVSPFFIGMTRLIKARLQKRRGVSPLQPYKDLWKLFHKNEIMSRDASWISSFAPYFIWVSMIFVAFNVPLFTTSLSAMGTADFLVILYCMALGTFFLALAGLDAGGGFGGFGASREMMIAALAEGALIVSLLVPALLSSTTNTFSVSAVVDGLSFSHFTPLILAFMGFFIALLAETCRYPFDNPSTHLELTMIHEAMILEYSGKRLALLEWASAQKYMIFLALAANIFFPHGIAHSSESSAVALGIAWLVAKLLILCCAIAILESTIAKLRIFRLPGLLATSFILSIVALGLML